VRKNRPVSASTPHRREGPCSVDVLWASTSGASMLFLKPRASLLSSSIPPRHIVGLCYLYKSVCRLTSCEDSHTCEASTSLVNAHFRPMGKAQARRGSGSQGLTNLAALSLSLSRKASPGGEPTPSASSNLCVWRPTPLSLMYTDTSTAASCAACKAQAGPAGPMEASYLCCFFGSGQLVFCSVPGAGVSACPGALKHHHADTNTYTHTHDTHTHTHTHNHHFS